MLPAGLEPRSFLGADAMSNSELGTLARCEQAWKLGYTGEREKSSPSKAMERGTEVHRLWGHWWMNGGPVLESEDPTAALLMDRYDRFNREHRYFGRIKFLGNEVPVAARFSWGTWFFGFADGLAEVTGYPGVPDGLYVAECKTADKLSAVTYLVQSTQTPLYVWSLRQMGIPVRGSFIDVLRTSGNEPKIETKADSYKRHRAAGHSVAVAKELQETDRLTLADPPLAESFDRRFLLEGDGGLDIAGAIGQARRASGVRRSLLDGDPALKNIGPSCGWCFCNAVCFGLDVSVEDESEQPF
jgi:hypothetical protein